MTIGTIQSYRTACRFTFEDSPAFDGFTDGSRWNGFDNVWITPKTREAIVSWFADEYGDPDTLASNADMMAIPADDNGLICLGCGYATQIVTTEAV